VTHETTASLSDGQKIAIYMDNVYSRILSCNPHVKLMIVSKSQRSLKTNCNNGLSISSCILNFTDKVRVLMNKMFPGEEIEHVRIKGKRDEVFACFDDELLEIIVIERERNKTGI
jgi:hypothetical protein